MLAVAVLGLQVTYWLKHGEWVAIPTGVAFVVLDVDLSSVMNSKNWLGLAKIAQWILGAPLAIVLPVTSWIVAALVIWFYGD